MIVASTDRPPIATSSVAVLGGGTSVVIVMPFSPLLWQIKCPQRAKWWYSILDSQAGGKHG